MSWLQKALFFYCLSLLFFSSLRPVMAAVGTDTMIGYWKFDGSTQGTSAPDSSGDSRTAVPFGTGGGPIPSAVKPTLNFGNDYSISFNGSDQYYEVSSVADLNVSTFTMAFWVRLNEISNSYQTFAGKWQVGVNQQYLVQLNDTNRIGFWTGDGSTGGAGTLEATLELSEETWYHVTAVANGTSKTLYINGTDNVYSGTGTAAGNSNVEFTIGSKKNDGGTYFEFLDGQIDDLRFYNRVLSTTEIDALADGNHTVATWDGSSSTNTETAANWDINVLPDPYTRWVIADVANQPIATAHVAMAGLTINTGAWFDLASYNLTMNDTGTFSNNGTLRLQNSQTVTGFTNDTDSGTVLVRPTGNTTGFKTGNTYNNLVLNDGLMGYWKLDEALAGDTVVDASGFENNGTPTGASGSNNRPQPSLMVPNVNFLNDRSLSFDGTDDYVNCSVTPHSLPSGSGARTIAAWINGSSFTDGYGKTIVGWGNDSGGELSELRVTNNLKVEFHGNGNDVSGATTLSTGQWYHLATTIAADGSVILYVNGLQDGTGTVSLNTPITNCKIGRQPDFNAQYFNGLIDDVRIYDRVLTDDEIEVLAAGDEPALNHTTLTLDSALTVNGNLVLNAGTLDVDSSNHYAVDVSGNFENNGGVFTARNGTVTLGGADQVINSSNFFYNLTKSVSTARTLTFGQNSTTTISNALTLNGANSNLLSLRSSTTDIAFKLNPQSTRSISYVNVKDSNNINATVIEYSATNTYGTNLTNWLTSGPTPTPTVSSIDRSAPTPEPSAPTCSAAVPIGAPDLFQIDVTDFQAILYFTPVKNVDRYVVAYGYQVGEERFGTEVRHAETDGVLALEVNMLDHNLQYVFKVRGGNDCMPGAWSNEMVVKTATRGSGREISYFKNFASRVRSYLGRGNNAQVLGTQVAASGGVSSSSSNSCEYMVEPGDSLWRIASKRLGSGVKWSDLVRLNSGIEEERVLQIGWKVMVC